MHSLFFVGGWPVGHACGVRHYMIMLLLVWLGWCVVDTRAFGVRWRIVGCLGWHMCCSWPGWVWLLAVCGWLCLVWVCCVRTG